MIFIENKKKIERTLNKLYPNAKLLDITSKAETRLVQLSPFYPHGNIPIPFSNDKVSMSVEGIWQGLKVFESEDIDIKCFENDTMRNIKRTVRKYGKPLGHRKGVFSNELLDYISARFLIYLPSYLWVLENKVQNIIDRLRIIRQEQDIVLLDYTTNSNLFDTKSPLSHAYLVKGYLEGNYPSINDMKLNKSKSQEIELNPEFRKIQNGLENVMNDKLLCILQGEELTSQEIVKILDLNIKPSILTRELKENMNIKVISGKPLKFTLTSNFQNTLFDLL